MIPQRIAQVEDSSVSKTRMRWGNRLINFCVVGLILSSLFKFSQLPGPIAYMASLGYERATYFLIAALELLVAVVFWFRPMRPLGLLLVSSYFGGAISAHLATSQPSLARGPYMAYMLSHPLVGTMPACAFLAIACMGVWLRHPKLLSGLSEKQIAMERNKRPDHEVALPTRS